MPIQCLLNELVVDGSRITFKANPAFHKRFLRDDLIVEYGADVSLAEMDDSILSIPFLLNALPLVWLSGDTYSIRSLDFELAAVLEQLRQAFRRLYPECSWKGELIADNLIRNQSAANRDSVGALFSGGLDSMHACLANHSTTQILIRILTAHDAQDSHNTAMNNSIMSYVQRVADAHEHQASFVTSNVFTFISAKKLAGIWPRPRRWLVEVQYGLGFVGLTSPLLHNLGLSKLIIAGCELDHYGFAFGSHPDIVTTVRWAGVEVVEEGLGLRRQQKVGVVHSLMSDCPQWLVDLKTCLHPGEGFENCCDCSKCLQTIVGLIGAGADPRDYGFKIDPEHAFRKLRKQFAGQQLPLFDVGELLQWMDIQVSIRGLLSEAQCANSSLGQACLEDALWFAGIDLGHYFARFHGRFRRGLRRTRYRVALFLDAWPAAGKGLRRMLRPLLRWR